MSQSPLTHWLFTQALPFWAETGCDGVPGEPARLGAHEHLALDGTPALPGFKRVRVQARQLFVFSWAALQGWEQGLEPARGIFRFLQHARLPGGGWARRLTREGDILDPSTDLYDLAFVLFALSWHGRIDPAAIDLARDTVRWITENMAAPHGGFYNVLPVEESPRQQNPHMHLFEAALALFVTTGDPADLALAHGMQDLLTTRFFNPATQTLGEFFTADWQPDPSTGQIVEPGHHFEWVWLLSEYQRLTGTDVTAMRDALFDFACRHGMDRKTGLVLDRLDPSGAMLSGASRLWGQTEALRSMLRMKRSEDAARIEANLLRHYLTGCPPGTWIDQIDPEGRPDIDKIPASSLYHIVAACAEQ